MKQIFVFAIILLTPSFALGQTQIPPTDDTATSLSRSATAEMVLDDFLWTVRPVIVFADSPNDPRYMKQMDLLNARLDELTKRDVVVITDTDPDAKTPLREKLRPRNFMLVLIGKDGTILLQKTSPWDVRDRRVPPKSTVFRPAHLNVGYGPAAGFIQTP